MTQIGTFSSLVKVYSSFFPQTFIPAVEQLYIVDNGFSLLASLVYFEFESAEWWMFIIYFPL